MAVFQGADGTFNVTNPNQYLVQAQNNLAQQQSAYQNALADTQNRGFKYGAEPMQSDYPDTQSYSQALQDYFSERNAASANGWVDPRNIELSMKDAQSQYDQTKDYWTPFTNPTSGFTTYASPWEMDMARSQAGDPSSYASPSEYNSMVQFYSRTPEQNQYAGNADMESRNAANKEKHSAFKKMVIGGSLAALGALAAPAVFGGGLAAAPSATGISAGSALPSTSTGWLSSFAAKPALSGAASGALSGFASDGIEGALKGGLLGGLTGGYGGSLAGSLGLDGLGSEVFQGALKGATGGIASGDAKGALLGAGLGGVGGYVTGGGLSDTMLGRGLEGLGINVPTGAEEVAKTTVNGGGSLGGLVNLKSYIGPIANIYGGYQQDQAIKDAEDRMMQSQSSIMQALQPYNQAGLAAQKQLSDSLAAGFNPGNLADDPGYQFRLQQGQKALDRSLAAQGMSQSGAALKAAQEYGQGLAATEYGNAYDRWLAQNQQLAGQGSQGLNAATNIGNVYGNMGNIGASSALGRSENKNKTIAALLQSFGLLG